MKERTFFYQPGRMKGVLGQVRALFLDGALIRFVDSPHGVPALELLHTRRRLLHNADYVTLFPTDLKEQQRWLFALRTVCSLYDALYTNLLPPLPPLMHFERLLQSLQSCDRFNRPEASEWLNLLLARAFVHVSESNGLHQQILDYLAHKFSEKLEERQLQDTLTALHIAALHLGTHAPHVGAFAGEEPRGLGGGGGHDLVRRAVRVDDRWCPSTWPIAMEMHIWACSACCGCRSVT